MSDDHKRGSKKGKFCAVPGTPCECGNNYIEICKPAPSWDSHTFARLIRRKGLPPTSFQKKYEAHHLLCVASVSDEIVSKTFIEGVVKETKWCINNKDNMIGMPLWGHTVKWYCDITAVGGEITENPEPPPFKDIPQHDWDHNCNGGYTWEVTESCKKLAKNVEKAGHDIKPENLKGALDQLSGKFRNILLNVRGTRGGGTHEGWKKGLKNPESDWFQAFSMASTVKITKKGFPVRVFDDKVALWIKRIAAAIAGGV